MSPILVTYKRTLDSRFDSIDSETVLQFFKQTFKKQGVSRFEMKDHFLMEFKTDGFMLLQNNWNKWTLIKRGKIEIRQSVDKRTITYQIDMTRMLITGLSMALLMAIVLSVALKGISFVVFLGFIPPVVNSLMVWNQHDDNLTGILNDLLNAQSKKTNNG